MLPEVLRRVLPDVHLPSGQRTIVLIESAMGETYVHDRARPLMNMRQITGYILRIRGGATTGK